MKALTFQGLRTIRHESVEDPRIKSPTDAIVRVEQAAICGSDMHLYHEREPAPDAGTVMGHEFVGEVVEAGPEVGGITRGVRVLSPFSTSCGSCFYCRSGLTARCVHGQLFGWVQEGRGLQGGQAEYVRVPLAASTLVALPEDVLPEEGLLLGDVLSTGYHCAKMAGVEPGGIYAVVGCGPVGLMAVVGARVLGAERIFAIDSVPDRLERARAYGATPVDFSRQNPVEVLHEATDGQGADAVLEVVGSADALRSAYDLVRPGGTVSVVGVHHQGFAFSPSEAYDKNLTFRIGRCPARHVLQELIPVVQQKRFDLASVLSHRLPLDRGVEGYRLFDERRDGCTKVLLLP